MPKKKPQNEIRAEEQFKRFEKTAQEHGVEENADMVEHAFKELASPQQKNAKKSKPSTK